MMFLILDSECSVNPTEKSRLLAVWIGTFVGFVLASGVLAQVILLRGGEITLNTPLLPVTIIDSDWILASSGHGMGCKLYVPPTMSIFENLIGSF
jgi:hypothetical protein